MPQASSPIGVFDSGVGGLSVLRALLAALHTDPRMQFWPDALSYADLAVGHIVGHRPVTDAYLAGVALSRGGRLATLDTAPQRGVAARGTADSPAALTSRRERAARGDADRERQIRAYALHSPPNSSRNESHVVSWCKRCNHRRVRHSRRSAFRDATVSRLDDPLE